MKHLMNREDYIREYLRVSKSIDNTIETEQRNENELFEGLLGTLFGGLKMLLNKDWENIKCKNPSVLKHLKEMDKSLAGYTMIKMQYSSECQNIRQNIANYFNDILEYKLSQIEDIDSGKAADKFLEKENKEKEEEKELKGVAKILNLKDKNLLDKMKKYKDNISVACKPNGKLREYADQLLNSVTIFVNDVIISELEKKGAAEEKLEAERKKIEEEEKKLQEVAKKMSEVAKKASEEELKKIAQERDEALKSLGVTPLAPMKGDQAVDRITSQFKDILGNFDDIKLNESNELPGGYSDFLKSDTYIGIQKSLEEIDWNTSKKSKKGAFDKFIVRVILSKINNVFKIISDQKKMFAEVPSASVQAMMVALSNAVIRGYMGDKFDIVGNESRISILTKCAIDSDATVGFNLPLIDPTKPDNGNIFVGVMNQFVKGNVTSDEFVSVAKATKKEEKVLIVKEMGDYDKEKDTDDKALNAKIDNWGKKKMSEFKQNMTKLFDEILKKAKEIKDAAENQRKKDAAKQQAESDNAENAKK